MKNSIRWLFEQVWLYLPGRDTVNQLGKVAPGIIKHASLEINNVAQQRINQIISQDVPPKILSGAVKDVY